MYALFDQGVLMQQVSKMGEVDTAPVHASRRVARILAANMDTNATTAIARVGTPLPAHTARI